MDISDITQHCFSSLLEVHFNNGEKHFIAFEILRIYSPAASIMPLEQSPPPLVTDKAFVKISALEFDSTGMSITFDDAHISGHYSTAYLKQICDEQDTLWRDYLARIRYAKQLKNDAMTLTISD